MPYRVKVQMVVKYGIEWNIMYFLEDIHAFMMKKRDKKIFKKK